MVRTWVDRVNDLVRVIEVSAQRGNLQNVTRARREASRRAVVAQRNGRLDEAEAYRGVMDYADQYLRGDRPDGVPGLVRRRSSVGRTRRRWVKPPFRGPIPPGLAPAARVPPAPPPARPDPGMSDAEVGGIIAGQGATDAVLEALEAAGVPLDQIRRVVQGTTDYRYHEDPRTDPDQVAGMIEERGGPTDRVLDELVSEGVPPSVIRQALEPPTDAVRRQDEEARVDAGGVPSGPTRYVNPERIGPPTYEEK